MTVGLFRGGHKLYDEIVTPYGPFYYLYQYVIHDLFRVPLDDDWTRMTTVLVWIVTASVPAGWTWVETRRASLAVLVYVGTLLYLQTLRRGPGHPQELDTLLVEAAATIPLFAGSSRPRWAAVGSGILVAALVLTKLNIGVFLFLSIFLSLAFSTEGGRVARVLRPAAIVAAVALPFVLVRSYLPSPWALAYASTISLSVLSISIAAWPRGRDLSPPPLVHYLLSCTVAAVLISSFAISTGSTLPNLIDGLLRTPLRLSKAHAWPLWIPNSSIAIAMLSTALACMYGLLVLRDGIERNSKYLAFLCLAKFSFALWMLIYPTRTIDLTLGAPKLDAVRFGTAFLWLGTIRLPAGGRGITTGRFRVTLCLIAALQPLQIFPVPFDQYFLGTFLQIAVAAICLGDILDWFDSLEGELPFERLARQATLPLILACSIFALAWVDRKAYQAYRSLDPVEARGTTRLRVPEQQNAAIRWLVANIGQSYETFLSNTGFNSLYFWTGKAHPGTIVIGNEVDIYTDDQQRAIVESLSRHPNACVVFHPSFSFRISRTRILLDHLDQEFVTYGKFDLFELRARKGRPHPDLRECGHWVGKFGGEARVEVEPMTGQALTGLRVLDAETSEVVADSSSADPKLSLKIKIAGVDGGGELLAQGRPGLDLSAPKRLILDFARAPESKGPFLIRLIGGDGRTLKTLPMLDPE